MKQIKLMKLNENATTPKFAKNGDSGFDMYTLEDTIIKAGETKLVKTGIAVDLEEGYEIQVRPRSGVSLNGMKGCYKYIEPKSTVEMNGDGLVSKVSDSKGTSEIVSYHCDTDMNITPNETVSPYLRVQFGTVDSKGMMY